MRYLVRMIDDATSRSWGRFVKRDGTRENMGVLWEYVERFGRMVDYYTDRDSMFAVAPRPGESKEQQRAADRLTQIGRALRELGIGWIAAYSPQAKGRVERSFLTDQDRLIKELRLAKVNDDARSQRVSGKRNTGRNGTRISRVRWRIFPDQHRALDERTGSGRHLCHVEERVIANDYTFSFAGQRYQIRRSNRCKRGCGASGCAWNFGWTVS